MVFFSVTRLRVRSWLYVPAFTWRTLQTVHQVQRSAGYLGGCLLREKKNIFWTMTAWQDGAAMNAYRISGPHRQAMPKLLDWCDEASVVHWNQQSAELPTWAEAHRRMVEEGRLSKVRHPSAAQKANTIQAPIAGSQQRKLPPH